MTQNGRSNYEAVIGSKQFFFFIFLTFGRDTTNYRGTLVENVKKVKIQPTLLSIYIYELNMKMPLKIEITHRR
jgi:hypothetical protein